MEAVRVLQDYVSAARSDDCQRLWELTSEDFRSSPETFCEPYVPLVSKVDLAEGTLKVDETSDPPMIRLVITKTQVISLRTDPDGPPEVTSIILDPQQ